MISARAATTGIFVVNGAAIGTWVAQIPYVQERLDISKSVVGLALLCMAAGALLAMPLTGRALTRRPSAGLTRAAVLAECVVLPLPVLAPSPWTLAAALVVFGAANGATDVAMNSHGIAVEKQLRRPIMSSLHAGWSLGGLAGAGIAGLSLAAGLDARAHMGIAAAILLVASAWLSGRLGDASTASEEGRTGFALPPRGVVLLGTLCFLVMVAEGAMGDWSALYLKGDLGATAGFAATGFAGFSLGMAVGRLGGDALTHRWGPAPMLRWGMALVATALSGLLAAGEPAVAVAGFTLVGLGIANAVPLLFSAAGRVPGTPPAQALAAVFTMGYTGFIAGPPLIGLLADAVSLPVALATLCAAAAIVAVLGGRAAMATEPMAAGTPEAAPAR